MREPTQKTSLLVCDSCLSSPGCETASLSHERAGTSGSHLDVQRVTQHPARTTEPVSTFSTERPGQWALGAQLAQAPVRISPEIELAV